MRQLKRYSQLSRKEKLCRDDNDYRQRQRALGIKYRAEHLDKCRTMQKNWRKAHPDKLKDYAKNAAKKQKARRKAAQTQSQKKAKNE